MAPHTGQSGCPCWRTAVLKEALCMEGPSAVKCHFFQVGRALGEAQVQ